MAIPSMQPSFGAGEISPSLYGRVDFNKWHSAASTMRNFFVNYRGGAMSRAGTAYVGMCKQAAPNAGGTSTSNPPRDIPFKFSLTQAYVLEFGDLYMRVKVNGAYATETSKAVTGISQANPGVITSAAHGFSNGDWVYISGVVGMTDFNARTWIVQNVTTNTFTLTDLFGTTIDTSAFSAYVSGGTAARIYTLTTPWAAIDLPFLKFDQSADTMSMTCVNQVTGTDYPPYDLVRNGLANWSITTTTFATTISAPTGVSISVTSSTTLNTWYSYVVTAVSSTGEESVASSAVSHQNNDIAVNAGANLITWTAVSGAVSYNIYKAYEVYNTGGSYTFPAGILYGFCGSVTGTSFTDPNITADFTKVPPQATNPFTGTGKYPGCVGYFQQRRVYAATKNNPDTYFMSQPGAYTNMDTATPTSDSDAITGTPWAKQVNGIQFMVQMPSGLIVLTGSGAWQLAGANGGAFTPSNQSAAPQAYNGVSYKIQPLQVNYDILYVQAKGSIVRDLSYNFYAAVYTGEDLTVLSNHLFYDRTIKSWTFSEEPYKIVWIIRDDGTALSLTYLKEQQIYGWARHDTNGLFESVCSISEPPVDATYFIVKRNIRGKWAYYSERMNNRLWLSAEDSWCVDCGLTYAGSTRAATLTASAATGTVTITADSSVFTSGDIGSVIRLGGGIGNITSFISGTEITAELVQDITSLVPNDPVATPVPIDTGDWTISAPTQTVDGLDHLEGKTVSILGDGNVFAQQVVTDGKVTLSTACSLITIGLPYTCQLQTLYLDQATQVTVQGRRKDIFGVTVRVEASRGMKVGTNQPDASTQPYGAQPSWSNLREFKERKATISAGQPIPLFTGDERISVPARWDPRGQVAIQQEYPLPCTVLAVIPETNVGDTPS